MIVARLNFKMLGSSEKHVNQRFVGAQLLKRKVGGLLYINKEVTLDTKPVIDLVVMRLKYMSMADMNDDKGYYHDSKELRSRKRI
ncbi:hypothetical protein J6590_066693 [Homalodisca vitripennis]|nr:hypothetical protein J6590_066693 [Homalodisca vitripennis]